MTREDISNKIKNSTSNCIILSLPTGMGKSKLALDACYSKGPLLPKVLIVYPKKVNKNNWISEYNKWGYEKDLSNTTFTTYNSLYKYANEHWDVVIFDEGHHLSDAKLDVVKVMSVDRAFILSATVPYTFIYKLRTIFPNLEVERVKTQEAIDNSILPDPQIILWPITLNIKDKTEKIIKNSKATKTIEVEFSKRHLCKDKNIRYIIHCTQWQYCLDLDNMIEWYKKKAMGGNQVMKNLWLHKAGERLKWLAGAKLPYIFQLLTLLKNQRTLTFCGTIEQTELVGSNCIHSKNKAAQHILDAFNNKQINHITACSMLDECINLTDCRIGIFANINSSEKLQIQRIGRVLRHKSPMIIIPYFRDTREEEIVHKMVEGYNNIKTIKSLNEIKL